MLGENLYLCLEVFLVVLRLLLLSLYLLGVGVHFVGNEVADVVELRLETLNLFVTPQVDLIILIEFVLV